MPLTQFVSYLRHAAALVCLAAASLPTQACVGQVGAQPKAEATTKSPSWMRVVDKAPFSPRDTAEDIVVRGKMWLSNGYVDGGKLVRDLWSSSDGVAHASAPVSWSMRWRPR